ncbi:MAG TPA: alpha/beta hydrolase [Ferruginibacter sp.]|nr:alpha/beta hydrolase [Ferruginibacter sp.]
MAFEVKSEQRFKYCEEGTGDAIVLLHGLFGALSNFNELIEHFAPKYNVAIPLLPLYDLEISETTVTGMVDYIDEFIAFKQYKQVHVIGNSLGGHIAQLYYLRRPEKVKTMTLTGSSGLFENSLGETYPRKSDYDYMTKKTQATFYNPALATKELIDEVFEIVNNRAKAIRLVSMAKSALRHNLRDSIPAMQLPVCLIWGKNDTITPPFVAEEFKQLLPDAELHIIDQCGHAPMMEQPEEFNKLLEAFLAKN